MIHGVLNTQDMYLINYAVDLQSWLIYYSFRILDSRLLHLGHEVYASFITAIACRIIIPDRL